MYTHHFTTDRHVRSSWVSFWSALHASNEYSLPSEEGVTAIVYALEGYDELDPDATCDQIRSFEEDAYFQRANVCSLGRSAALYAGMTRTNWAQILTDRDISDVIVIGNGTFSTVRCDDGEKLLSWRELSNATDHLKRGELTQRTCGVFRHNLNVPLGSMVVSNHRNLVSPFGDAFCPEIDQSDERLLRNVCTVWRLDYDYIKRYCVNDDEFDKNAGELLLG